MAPVLLPPPVMCYAVVIYLTTAVVLLQAEYAAALQRYKAATFVDSLSDEELAAAQKVFDEAMTLFKRGALQQALVMFDEVGTTHAAAFLKFRIISFISSGQQRRRPVQARRAAAGPWSSSTRSVLPGYLFVTPAVDCRCCSR
jgi:hypothetical protein